MDEINAEQRLAVYGSLAPRQSNHYMLRGLDGVWRPGIVHGHLRDQGWGAKLGYPGIVLDPAGPAVAVMVLTSADLPGAWPRLDDFEGPAYRRTIALVEFDDSTTAEVNIYELRNHHHRFGNTASGPDPPEDE